MILLVVIVGLFIGLLDPIEIERGHDNVTIVTSKSLGTVSWFSFHLTKEVNDIALVGKGFCNNKTNIVVCNNSDCFAGSSNAGNKGEVNDACSSKYKL